MAESGKPVDEKTEPDDQDTKKYPNKKTKTSFKAGEGWAGNPNGRPKKVESLSAVLRALGKKRDVHLSNGQKIARRRAVAEKVWQMALNGDPAAIKLLYDRVDGTATQHIITEEKTVRVIPAPKPTDKKPEESADGNG